MNKTDSYRNTLLSLDDWDPFLLANSGLPGPRGNLELAQAAADAGDPARFEGWLAWDAARAPVNSPHEFLAFCGVLGLGKLLAGGDGCQLERLRLYAADPRWRTREAVAMALQRWGKTDMPALLEAMDAWSEGSPWEQRAAAAALCEPALLVQPAHARRTLQILDAMTAAIQRQPERKSAAFQALKKGLGYCWSVAVAALPAEGKPIMSPWLSSPDGDIRWIMRANLKKNRLLKMDPAWVQAALRQLA